MKTFTTRDREAWVTEALKRKLKGPFTLLNGNEQFTGPHGTAALWNTANRIGSVFENGSTVPPPNPQRDSAV